MEFTFINVLLLLAMVAVSMLFGFRIGYHRGYNCGFVTGIKAASKYERKNIFKRLPKSEVERILREEKKEDDEFFEEINRMIEKNSFSD